jgi:hypothetical protein
MEGGARKKKKKEKMTNLFRAKFAADVAGDGGEN